MITYLTGNDYIPDIGIQTDGSIVAAAISTNNDFTLLRYHPDGSIDSGFGSSGIVTTDFNGGMDLSRSLLIQRNGKIVAAGSADVSFGLARYIP